MQLPEPYPSVAPIQAIPPQQDTVAISDLSYDGLFKLWNEHKFIDKSDEETSTRNFIQKLHNSVKNEEESQMLGVIEPALLKIDEANQLSDKKERAKRLISERMKLKRLFESTCEREKRLQRMRDRYKGYRNRAADMERVKSPREATPATLDIPEMAQVAESNSTSDVVEKPSEEQLFSENSQTSSETPAETCDSLNSQDSTKVNYKEHRLQKLKEYQKKRLQNETLEQRERRLTKMREAQRARREAKKRQAALQNGAW